MKPNVFCVGAGKCGTTWLYGLLESHPECCASDVKETMFFEHYHHRGVKWYERHFDTGKQHRVVSEVSNTYIFSPVVAERIHGYNPDAQIVITVRNPIERALSHYLFLKRGGMDLPSFEEAVRSEAHRHILWRGRYFQHMQAYLNRFGADQVKVLVFEDLKTDQDWYARDFLRFIGVSESYPDFDHDRFRLPASAARSRVGARLLKHGANLARDAGLGSVVQSVKNSFVPRLAYRPLTADERPTVSTALLDELHDYFRDDVASLSDWLSRDLTSLWLREDATHAHADGVTHAS